MLCINVLQILLIFPTNRKDNTMDTKKSFSLSTISLSAILLLIFLFGNQSPTTKEKKNSTDSTRLNHEAACRVIFDQVMVFLVASEFCSFSVKSSIIFI